MLASTMRPAARITALLACAALALAGCSSPADDYLHGLEDVCENVADYVDTSQAGDADATDEAAIAAVDGVVGWTELPLPDGLSPATIALDEAFRADDFETRLMTDPQATFEACVGLEAAARADLGQ
jgi:hypothetical protein